MYAYFNFFLCNAYAINNKLHMASWHSFKSKPLKQFFKPEERWSLYWKVNANLLVNASKFG